ncbi:unnamed protein product [Vicia faba]|uniref:Uncharacterized protein n=1 Tax=Vicia faba TaxID=3906 RepID=A0AAV0Z906_VICFA|nr:unnamed protein product [Vicia faba]
MAECELPSFSLGFDLDPEDTPPHSSTPDPILIVPDSESDPILIVPDSESDPETRPEPPRRIFKRLRHGLPSSTVRHQPEPPPCIDVDDDDIEEFSDEHVQVSARSSVRNQNSSICRSSKVSLKSIGVLTPHSSTNSRDKKREPDLEIPDSVELETGHCGSMFRKLMTSPLRRFQLIESDDDDDDDDVMVDENVDGGSKPMCNKNTPVISLERDSKRQFDDVKQNTKDLPIHLSPVKSFSIPRDKQGSAGLETGQSGSVFPNGKLAASPLRRFQLVDSDDDDVMVCEAKVGPSLSTGNRNRPPSSLKQDKKVRFVEANQNQKHLSPVKKNFSIPTPAFNDECEEYFHSAKDTQLPKSNEPYREANSECQKDEQTWEAAGDNTVNQQENIDYMGQFNNGGSTSRRSKSKNLNDSEGWVDPKIIPSSTRKKATKRNNNKKNNETSKLNTSNDSASWVEPKDAGQRRVQASGEQAGHWYTGSDGRKVYVNKSGKESTGRNAYRSYRKDSGAASKKKTTAKKGK